MNTRGKKRSSNLDMNDFRNWKKSKLVSEIEELGGVVHPSWNLTVLRQSYELMAQKQTERHVSNATVVLNDDNQQRIENNTVESESEENADNASMAPLAGPSSASDIPPSHSSVNTHINAHASAHQILPDVDMHRIQHGGAGQADKTIAAATNAISSMVDVVKNLVKKSDSESDNHCFNLESAMLNTFGVRKTPLETDNGTTTCSKSIYIEDIPKTDMVSKNMRKQILEGKEINFACLLVPHYDTPQKNIIQSGSLTVQLQTQKDPRLNQNLTIDEFNLAFYKFKNVMTKAYPSRKADLDVYQMDIGEISRNYGPQFYLYHKMFVTKAAAAIAEHNLVCLWSKVDEKLLNRVMHGVQANTCSHCFEIDHTTRFCPLQSTSDQITPPRSGIAQVQQPIRFGNINHMEQKSDKRGRTIVKHNEKTICNNFNDVSGCRYAASACYYSHVCKNCRSSEHSAQNCNSDRNILTRGKRTPNQESKQNF